MYDKHFCSTRENSPSQKKNEQYCKLNVSTRKKLVVKNDGLFLSGLVLTFKIRQKQLNNLTAVHLLLKNLTGKRELYSMQFAVFLGRLSMEMILRLKIKFPDFS